MSAFIRLILIALLWVLIATVGYLVLEFFAPLALVYLLRIIRWSIV